MKIMNQQKIDGYTLDKRQGYVRNNKEYIPHTKPIPYLLVKNYFNDKDIELMLKELRFLTPKMTFQDGTNLPTKDHKKNTQINLDDFTDSLFLEDLTYVYMLLLHV